MNPSGTILILNGVSSSGKTSILKSFQDLAPEAYLEMGIDKFLWMLPWRYLNTKQWSEVVSYRYNADDTIAEVHATRYGSRLISGMHHAIRDIALQGINVIADHVFHEEGWVRECASLLSNLPAYLIAIRCPLEVLEEREKSRQNRTLGQARALYNIVHAHCVYDFEVDTSLLSIEESTRRILEFVQSRPEPKAFNTLYQQVSTHTQ